MKLTAVFFALAFAMMLRCGVESRKNPQLYNIVLVGATGDLAKKYLWKALFNLFGEKFVKDEVKIQLLDYNLLLLLNIYV